ncbi:hypothetical protein NQ318_023305 [Aromia moschata]|uniref:Uncharacterized protein n=1 Tax=Aromia moschata TaxID=1265417 RepID=A0AAV8XV27_9CUCU|nr:hypothetical protein NQ318_023305 [Aromia moschata]
MYDFVAEEENRKSHEGEQKVESEGGELGFAGEDPEAEVCIQRVVKAVVTMLLPEKLISVSTVF